jgi:hydroxypyruvate reductase
VKNTETKLRKDARAIFGAALSAANARNAVLKHLRLRSGKLMVRDVTLPLREFDRISLIAAGKAAVAMAGAVKQSLGDRLNGESLVVTKRGHVTEQLRQARVFEAAHPIPDEVSESAAKAVRDCLKELNARDLLVVAVSGGASALLAAPCEGVSLEEKKRTTELLLRAGADIAELNTVRKHLSLLKGGGLAALAYPATVLTLILSDVIGDRLDVIGSGMTAPDPTSFAQALAIVHRFRLGDQIPRSVLDRLERGEDGLCPETPKEGDLTFENVHNVVIGSNALALDAARKEARTRGYRTILLSSSMGGEAREVARVHAAILTEVRRSGNPVRSPACVLSGGETTVTVHGGGKGGRNQEFALAAGIELAGVRDVLVFSAGTDGTDGPTDAAGAIATGSTVERAREAGLSAAEYLSRNDSYTFFAALDDLVKTGPTGTNVMDVHLLLAG